MIERYIYKNGNYIHNTAIVGRNVLLGKGNTIMPGAVIGDVGFIRDKKKVEGIIEIGDNNTIGCNVCIMCGEKGATKIGNNNLIMNFVNIGHNSIIGNKCEIGAGTIIAGYALIEDEVKIKIGARIRNRKTIGAKSIIGMGANVVSDIPKESTAIGNPAKCV